MQFDKLRSTFVFGFSFIAYLLVVIPLDIFYNPDFKNGENDELGKYLYFFCNSGFLLPPFPRANRKGKGY